LSPLLFDLRLRPFLGFGFCLIRELIRDEATDSTSEIPCSYLDNFARRFVWRSRWFKYPIWYACSSVTVGGLTPEDTSDCGVIIWDEFEVTDWLIDLDKSTPESELCFWTARFLLLFFRRIVCRSFRKLAEKKFVFSFPLF